MKNEGEMEVYYTLYTHRDSGFIATNQGEPGLAAPP